MQSQAGDEARAIPLPLNLGLSGGTSCFAACVEVLRRYASRTALPNHPTVDNRPLKEAIARIDGVA